MIPLYNVRSSAGRISLLSARGQSCPLWGRLIRKGGQELSALYLLAQFRERRAFPLTVKMFSAPGEISEHLGENLITDAIAEMD